MDLHQQLPPHVLQQLTLVQLQHGQHRNVGCPALDGRVDSRPQRVLPGRAAGLAAGHRVGEHSVWEAALPAQQRVHHPVLPRVLVLLVLPRLDLGAVGVPRLHRLLGLVESDSPVAAQAMLRLAVRDGEVEDLSLAALNRELRLQQRHGRLLLWPVKLKQALARIHSLHTTALARLSPQRLNHTLQLGRTSLMYGYMPMAVREWKSPPALKAVSMLWQLAMCAC